MRSRHVFHAVDSHTEGMPTRVITGGVGALPGATMADRRGYAIAELDQLRTLLMCEPRGHAAMSGAVLQPPTRPDADYGVLFIEVSGFLPMCGHGTIGVATVLVETGMVPVTSPTTTVRLDTPAGLVTAEVAVRDDGAATGVTIRNVAAYPVRRDATVTVPDLGEVRYDLAYGGNFYAIVELAELGLPVTPADRPRLLAAGQAIMAAVDREDSPHHPAAPPGLPCHGVYLAAPGSDARHSRHAMVIEPGWFDRSPCGTGTSARMAQLWGRGELAIGAEFRNESIIGTHFVGRLVEETTVAGVAAVVPEVTGRAWLTGTAQYLLDPEDPFPAGFTL
ncbi:proline racemase family protein [Natronosporangium hydrolyticum]|uniref:Proline racemase family protein n=1 Tax=Natronosporangium hydrolyticum TaxID=2811111 RepID=A0A895YHP6_9ACTN|nr:proline racemase family protein [Natronosporangium hydrolyticum]QSB14893.1 proline racemase family protein [Natronosporangium hydrolyticum]